MRAHFTELALPLDGYGGVGDGRDDLGLGRAGSSADGVGFDPVGDSPMALACRSRARPPAAGVDGPGRERAAPSEGGTSKVCWVPKECVEKLEFTGAGVAVVTAEGWFVGCAAGANSS